ncbi:MAG: Helix-hairpin-helix motif protein [candidate division BRC1 bacterium ADurb.BinA364]|nr:MAG: Helix-hairpin-helix motif protein [candidate division BRC1 bacterium ADurb.BinA364]
MNGMPADPGLAAEALEALSGVLTVYSQSRLAYESGGALYDSLDPNTATIEEIFEGLSRVFGDVPPGRLQQFAANIVDWRDADSIPTVYPGSSESAPILGVENTPFISEVWPDSLTTEADGDDGQYFEIANPYSFDVDLTGWTVGIGLSGRRISLSGALPAQGCLVVTDDKNDLRDASPEEPQNEYGSFFKIFSMLGDGYSRQLREEPLLNLPDDSGTLYLYDNAGNLIDYFQYQNMRLGGVRTSAQRDDPRARDYAKNRCSPMSLELSAAAKAALRSAANRDRAFASAAEVFDVCAAWTERASARSLDSASTSPWTRLKSAEGELDARLADLFAVGEDSGLPGNLAPMESYAARPAQNAAAGKPEAAGAENGLARMEREAVRQDTAIRRASGRINLNTASRAALLALPGMTADMANRILDRRAAGNGASGPSEGYMEGIGARPPFESIAGFLGDETIWSGKSREEKLALFGEWANRITINSQTFFVVAENQPEPQVGRTRPSVARIRSLMLVGANGRPEALNWRFEQ